MMLTISNTHRYESEEVIEDLLQAAHELLRVGGRLVYLFPLETTTWTGATDKTEVLPKHHGLRVVHFAHDPMRLGMSRILVTMEKMDEEGGEKKKRKVDQ
jgi:tRNA1(Val) A37 N6-methylase TrmN6